MRILADAGPIYNGQLTGVGYFTDELLKHLSQNTDLNGYAFNFKNKKSTTTIVTVKNCGKNPTTASIEMQH